MTDRPLQPTAAGRQTVFAVAGGNHVTIELDREDTDGWLDVIEVFAQPGAMAGYFAEAGVGVPDPASPPSTVAPGPAQLREISARWGIEFWTGPVRSPDGNG